MFKRAFWFTVGAGAGAGGVLWARHKVRRTVERVMPERLAQDLGDAMRSRAGDVRAAVSEGRVAMRVREAELRAELPPGTPPARR